MRVEEAKYSIAEIVDWYRRRDLVVNDEYQRGRGLWPASAKSYFIDTILKEFPFPKVYFYERVDRETRRPRREIVDGQQRLTTIVEFVDGKLVLGRNAVGFEGVRFNDLTEEQQNAFYYYTISVDVIRNAERSDILQMFRRMNAFTLPLNAAEKRHSEYFGEFKDWINTVLDKYGSMLLSWGLFSSRQVMRMADAELISDIVLAIEEGIISTSPKRLTNLYSKYDHVFAARPTFDDLVSQALDTLLADLSGIQGTYMVKPHIFHSLVCALLHNRFGLPGGVEATGLAPCGWFYSEREVAIASLKQLAAAHELKDLTEFPEYVRSASEGGNRASQRAIRIKWLCLALRGSLS